jgi:beta-glucosidase
VASLVDDADRVILQIKFATDMFDKPLPTLENMKATLRNCRHVELNRNMTRESSYYAAMVMNEFGKISLQLF